MIGVTGFLLKIGIGSIANKLAAAYEAKQRAQTDQERIAADERIKALEARRDVLVAESGDRVNRLVRALLALPVVILLWKVFVWDKVLGAWTQGRTDALSAELWQVVSIVVGFYFVTDAATRIFKR